MKKRFAYLFAALLMCSASMAQPAIDSTDMPFPGDTITRTDIASFTGLNYTDADSNFVWDFSMLGGTDKTSDTFISVMSTPFTYIAAFNNPFDQEHKSTAASKQPASPSPPGITIENIFGFFKARHDYYGQVGYGAEINGIPVPVQYNNADVQYRFPLQFGNVDSADSEFDLTIPGFGYYGEKKHRINYVDGWGTLYLPADTFDVFRVKSVITISDTIHMDSLGFGFQFDRTETEYKWLAKGYGLPVLHILKRQGGMGGNNTDGWFHDSRPPDFGQPEFPEKAKLNIHPNPAADHIIIQNPQAGAPAEWSLIDVNGRILKNGKYSEAEYTIPLDGIQTGCYLIRLLSAGKEHSGIFIRK